MKPSAGTILVASPQLTDANFARSVIYILDHGENGTLGFIINRPLEAVLGDIWSEVPAGLASAKAAAEGGPVEQAKGLLLHGCMDLPGAQAMGPGVEIAVGGDADALAERYRDGCDATGPRLFLGHSGWMPGQLDAEIGQGSWLVRPGRKELLLDIAPPKNLWQQLVEGRTGGLPEPSVN